MQLLMFSPQGALVLGTTVEKRICCFALHTNPSSPLSDIACLPAFPRKPGSLHYCHTRSFSIENPTMRPVGRGTLVRFDLPP